MLRWFVFIVKVVHKQQTPTFNIYHQVHTRGLSVEDSIRWGYKQDIHVWIGYSSALDSYKSVRRNPSRMR